MDRAAAGEEGVIRQLASAFGGNGGFGDYSFGQAHAANCYEVSVGSTASSVLNTMQRYPYLAAAGEIPEETDELCAAWQTLHAPLSFHAPVRSAVPVLLYGGEFDPATPYEDAVLASWHLSNSTLVLAPGASHAGMGVDECTRGIAHAFLDALARKPDLTCLQQRPAVAFPTEGLAAFLESMEG